MEQATLIETLLTEWNNNKQAVQAVQAETEMLTQELQPRRGGREKDCWTADKRQDLVSRLGWMTRLLETLTAEQKQAEKDLLIRLAPLLENPELSCFRQVSLAQCLQAMGSRPAAGLPKQTLNSGWKRLARLGHRGLQVWKTEGHRAFLIKGTRRVAWKLAVWLRRPQPAHVPYIFRTAQGAQDKEYAEWIRQNEPTAEELGRQRQTVFPLQPRISVVVPSYNTPLPFLLAAIESVRAQTYPHWELCIADGGSRNQCSIRILEYYARNDPRIKVALLPDNLGIAGNSNAALQLATGNYVAFLDHDDALPPFALYEVANAINCHPNADFLYSDEDKITELGQQRYCPHFKSAWAPDTLRSVNYICHLTIIGRALLKKLGGFRAGFDGSQDYDLVLRATEQANEIVHIPKVLYHWRSHPQSVAGYPYAKPYAVEAAKKALEEHLARCRIDGHVLHRAAFDCYRIVHRLSRRPLVSIVIPSRDHHEVLRRCLDSIACSTYTNYEIIIVENNSRDPQTFAYYAEAKKRPEVRIIPWNQPFNYAAATNFGVRQSRGEVLLFLNNDVEVINRDWLEALLEYALRPDVGAVGAKLYYPNGSIQHGGVVIGILGVAAHAGVFLPPYNAGYMRRLEMVHNLSAVTAACLMTPRSAYCEVGGLDERFILAFNDIDFCLKLRRQGYLIVWTPHAELYHFESLSRGQDDTSEKQARLHFENRLFKEKWKEELKVGDPFYSPNLSLEGRDRVWAIRTNEACPQHPRIVKQRSVRASQAA